MATGTTVQAALKALQHTMTPLRAEKDDLAYLRGRSSSTLSARTIAISNRLRTTTSSRCSMPQHAESLRIRKAGAPTRAYSLGMSSDL